MFRYSITWASSPAELDELGLNQGENYLLVDFEGNVKRLVYLNDVFVAPNGKEYTFDDFAQFGKEKEDIFI